MISKELEMKLVWRCRALVFRPSLSLFDTNIGAVAHWFLTLETLFSWIVSVSGAAPMTVSAYMRANLRDVLHLAFVEEAL